MVFRRESDLEKAAVPYLVRKGYKYTWQVPLHNRLVDLVAIDDEGNVIGIEFKLTAWKRALKQALRSANAFDYVYVCVPGGRYLTELISQASTKGIGVLTYDDKAATVAEALEPARISNQWCPNVERLRSYVETMERTR